MSIKSLIQNVGNIFGAEKKEIFALEIGQEWVKAALSKEVGGMRKIINLSAKKIAGSDDAAIVKTVKALVGELKAHQFALVVSLPRHSVTLRYIKLPSTNPAEIESIARLQAIKQLPYPKEELIISHKVLERDAEGYSKVMLVVVHKNILDKHLNILKKSGLEPELITLSTEAISQYLILGKTSAGVSADSAAVLVDIDSLFTEIQVQRDNKIIFSRSINYGLQSFGDKDKIKSWIEELKLTLNTYAREKDSVNIAKAILTGAAYLEKVAERILNEELGLPVEVVYPLQNINVIPKLESGFKRSDYALSFSSVIAMALDYRRLKINLLPQRIKVSQEKKSKYKTLASIVILTICVTLVLGIFLFKKLHDKGVYLSLLKEKLASVAPEAEILDKKAKIARIIKEQLKAEGSCLDIIREMHAITPQNIYLTKLIYDEGKGVTLKGSSPNMSQVFKYIIVLESSEYFENVKLRYASKRKKKGIDLTDFEIYSTLR